MEVKRICQWCGKPFMAKKTTTNYCSPQCSKSGYKHRMKERRMEMREFQEMMEVKNKLESQEYFTFSQAARLMGVSRQYVYKLVKEDKLRASRLSSRMSLIRRTDIELMLKTKPYEVLRPKDEFDVTEYYTAEQIAEKYKVNAKWVWTYTRQNNVPKVRIRQFNYYSKKHIDAAFAKYKTDDALTEWYTPEEIEKNYGMTRVAIRSHVYRNNIPSKKEHGQIFYSKRLRTDLTVLVDLLGKYKLSITQDTQEQAVKFGNTVLGQFINKIEIKCTEAEQRIAQMDNRIYLSYKAFYILIVILIALSSFLVCMIVANVEFLHSWLIWRMVAACGFILILGITMVIVVHKFLENKT